MYAAGSGIHWVATASGPGMCGVAQPQVRRRRHGQDVGGVHDAFPMTRVRWMPRVQRTVGGGDGGGDEVAVVQVAGVAGLPAEEQLPAGGRGQQGRPTSRPASGCGPARSRPGCRSAAGPRRPGAGIGTSRVKARARRTIMSATVLSGAPAVDRQGQPQRLQPVEVSGVDQGQPRADRGEGGVGLRLVELGAGQLDLPGADVVGDHQRGDVPGQVGVGDGGADRQLPADDRRARSRSPGSRSRPGG